MPEELPPERSFLWQPPPIAPDVRKFVPRGDAWWNQLSKALSKMQPRAREELARSSRDIVALLPDPLAWGERPSPYKGLVVGAVQSGKTSSMMGLTATAFDYGYRIVIILAGLKDDLRQQTARRFNEKLMHQSDDVLGIPGATTLGRPASPGALGGFALPYSLDTNKYPLLQLRMMQAIQQGKPCLIVVKKNQRSLLDLRSALMAVFRKFGPDNVPTLVLDDECDEASVPGSGAAAQAIPAQIASLLQMPGLALRTAYVGYTATAAANLLQSPESALYPSHFAFLLRYAGEDDDILQYKEPHPADRYTGAEMFYDTFGDEPGEDSNFLVRATIEQDHLLKPPEENPSLRDALRAYFVGGAYRLALQPDRSFEDPIRLPDPHAMLIHTSATIADHVEWAKALQRLMGGIGTFSKAISLDPARLQTIFEGEEAEWKEWYNRFEASRDRIYETMMRPGAGDVVPWEAVRSKLLDVFKNARVRIVNSDEEVGSTLDYAGGIGPDGNPVPPADIFTIIVGGSRLSRGITVDGLCISYFARWTPNPKEDTVQQMSRWFGYRGKHLEFCRLFVSGLVFEHLHEMYEHDTELRLVLARLMRRQLPPAEASIIMRANPHALPTAKLGAGTKVDLDFSQHVGVFQHVECGTMAEANEGAAHLLVEEIKKRAPEEIRREGGGKLRGWVSRNWTAAEVAAWLDRLSYSAHNPNPETRPLPETYRKQDENRPASSAFEPWSDPYQVAAYLRAWAADPEHATPTFNVAVAMGEIDADTAPFDFPLMNRTILPDDRLSGGWTGRGKGWRGDAFFDNPELRHTQATSPKRLSGAPGLLLLYIVHKDATGRDGTGKARQHHTPTFGISIPDGGPQFRWVVPKGV